MARNPKTVTEQQVARKKIAQICHSWVAIAGKLHKKAKSDSTERRNYACPPLLRLLIITILTNNILCWQRDPWRTRGKVFISKNHRDLKLIFYKICKYLTFFQEQSPKRKLGKMCFFSIVYKAPKKGKWSTERQIYLGFSSF